MTEHKARKRYPKTPEQREKQKLRIREKRASSEEFREANRVYARAYNETHRDERLEYAKRYRLRRDYGMTWEQFNEMLKAQHGKCGICGVLMDPPAKATKNSVAVTVDHDHDAGHVRGLLCYSCNLGLGIFKDSIVRLRAAVKYLERHEVFQQRADTA